jgi:hypothetical protein
VQLTPSVATLREVVALILEGYGKRPELPPARVSAIGGIPEKSAKLQVAECPGYVELSQTDPHFLGDNQCKIRVPYRVSYFLDLDKVRFEGVKYDRPRKLLTLRCGGFEVGEPACDISRADVEKVNPWFRSRASWLELKDKMLQRDLGPAARAEAEKNLPTVSDAGKIRLRDFLRRLLSAVDPEIQVDVE